MEARRHASPACSLVLAAVCLLVPAGCFSKLEVARLERCGRSGLRDGIPFYLPQQEFVVTELGLQESGALAPIRPLEVSLVTRGDPERAFLLRNSPGLFSGSEFSLARDEQGVLAAVSATSDEKTVEHAEALASLVVGAAAAAATAEERERLESELAVQRAAAARLIRELETAEVDRVRLIQLALANTHKRVQEIEALLRSQPLGERPSATREVSVEVAASTAAARERSKGIPARRITAYLIPADAIEGTGEGGDLR
jgi:hypothetical protein